MATSKPNIAALVAQMPETDKEIQARKEAEKPAQQPADPNAKKEAPKPDRWGAASKFTGPDPEFANELCEQVLSGGRDALIELVKLVRDPGDAEFKDYKAEYFLHALAIYVGAPERAAQQKLVVQTLASQLGNAKLGAHVRGFLVRELRVIGAKDAAGALGKLLGDEQLCSDAAAALVSLGQAEPLRDALRGAKGKCRLTIIQSLGAVRDEESAKALRAALADAEADVRLAAAWGLARTADVQAVDGLLKLADAEPTWERNKATHACLLLAENLLANNRRNDARRIYSHLRTTRTQPHEKYVRDIAEKALLALGIG